MPRSTTVMVVVPVIAAFLLVFAGTATAFPEASPEPEFIARLSFDSRHDAFDWSIGSNTINVMSELAWRDLAIPQATANLGIGLGHRLTANIRLTHGKISDGNNRDSDYGLNNRVNEISRSDNRGDGSVADFDFSIGRAFPLASWPVTVTPIIGFTENRHDLTATNGFQSIPAYSPYYGPFSGLNNTYEARWRGPVAGAMLQWQAAPRISLGAAVFRHIANYRAQANWNLRTDFAHPVSFLHAANGHGTSVEIDGSLALSDALSVSMNVRRESRTTARGTDTTFYADGSTGTFTLNSVNWDSSQVGLGLTYQLGGHR